MGERKADWRHGSLLLACSTLPVLGAILLGPVLPDVERHFASTPGVAIKVPIMLGLPALMIGLSAAAAGLLNDRVGRRIPLLIALALYGGVGILPIWLDSLNAIIAARVALGLTEAVVMVAATTLIGDYFDGAARERWLAAQGAVASLSATIFFGLGGELGTFGWRAPFLLYAVSFLLLPLAGWMVWEPLNTAQSRVRPPLPWRILGIAYAFTIVTGAALLVMPVQAGFVLNLLGVRSPATIGLVAASMQAAVFVGSLLFRPLVQLGFAATFAIGFACAGLGLVIVAHAGAQAPVIMGGCISGFGCGVLLVALITWAMGRLPLAIRGRGTGGFMASVFLGEFLSPAAMSLLAPRFGLTNAIGLSGWFLLAMVLPAVIAPLWAARARPTSAPSPII